MVKGVGKRGQIPLRDLTDNALDSKKGSDARAACRTRRFDVDKGWTENHPAFRLFGDSNDYSIMRVRQITLRYVVNPPSGLQHRRFRVSSIRGESPLLDLTDNH